MLFNSYQFIFIFMPVTLAGFFLISSKNHQAAVAWLALASIFFYSYWSLYALPIMIISICINYWFGLQLSNPNLKHRQALLIFAITANILALGYFKYANFFIDNTNQLRSIILPIGISFFTFTQIAFLIDNYQDLVEERNFLQYILFVTFFPHLLAGPLIHHKQMMPQFSDPNNFVLHKEKFALGIAIFTIGLFKKVLLADTLSGFVDGFFNSIFQNDPPIFWTSWLGSLAYTFQLYFDFSGYSDMAVGLGLLFGIMLPFNFNSPFKATSIIDFWQRWHITLTKYVGQYLYTPITFKFMKMGHERSAAAKTILSLVVPTVLIFLIMGLWHGANWTFVAFGGMHGIYIVVNHIWRKFFPVPGKNKKVPYKRIKNIVGWTLTFLAVNFANVMFRSDDVLMAEKIYQSMFGLNGFTIQNPNEWFLGLQLVFLVLICSILITFLLPNTLTITNNPKTYIPNDAKYIYPFVIALFGVICVLSIVNTSHQTTFLYFKF